MKKYPEVIYGPILITTKKDEDGNPIEFDSREHWNIPVEEYNANPELEAYALTGAEKPAALKQVMAGDDPENPVLTVPLRFNTAKIREKAFKVFELPEPEVISEPEPDPIEE